MRGRVRATGKGADLGSDTDGAPPDAATLKRLLEVRKRALMHALYTALTPSLQAEDAALAHAQAALESELRRVKEEERVLLKHLEAAAPQTGQR